MTSCVILHLFSLIFHEASGNGAAAAGGWMFALEVDGGHGWLNSFSDLPAQLLNSNLLKEVLVPFATNKVNQEVDSRSNQLDALNF